MRLKSLTLNGFKSFPDRTHLDFGPGVSVVVGPNGSGKSNVTDAVLWVMGEQSPLAVRGQSMQDVIFGGARGVQPRSAAEVEIVLDNSDGRVDIPLSEISIVRRLDRNGEGGYRLNGARCRLTDVLEVLSDTGLGKETHSVISQGRVDAIVTSKPRDRRLLIEEAAGLGKHRKRRRRAQLKLERTQENLDRALDVEREARSRLRPLKRQAEAAELHERLERQILQARWELARDQSRARRIELAVAQEGVAQARAARAEIERSLQETIEVRGAAERALSERAERHDALSRNVYEARSARERLTLRAEQVGASAQALVRRIERAEQELEASTLPPQAGESAEAAEGEGRIEALQAQLEEIAASREQEIEREIAELQAALVAQTERIEQAQAAAEAARAARTQADEQAEQARVRLAAAEREAQDGRRESARVGAELAAANQFLRGHAHVGADRAGSAKALSEELRVQDGYELALAAALGGRLDAALVEDVAGAEALLDRAGPDGGSALLASPGSAHAVAPAQSTEPPTPGALRLTDLLGGPPQVLELAGRLLADAWVVERLEELPADFAGIAATRSGRVWFAPWGEVRQLSEGGTERVLARRNERDRLIAEAERAAQAEHGARSACEHVAAEVRAAEETRMSAEAALREGERELSEAGELKRRTEWLIEQRRVAPAQGALAVRKAELEGELAAERRQAERRERERAERAARLERLRAQHEGTSPSSRGPSVSPRPSPSPPRASSSVWRAGGRAGRRQPAGEEMAGAAAGLRRQGGGDPGGASRRRRGRHGRRGRSAAAARSRRRGGARADERRRAAGARGVGRGRPGARPALAEEELAAALRARVERLTRRREQLGPVNPLAQEEYAEALAHAEELESQRSDLETALRELRGVIRETDKQIEETFEETFAAAARNFEELVGDVFPGGSGRLRLVADEQAPRPRARRAAAPPGGGLGRGRDRGGGGGGERGRVRRARAGAAAGRGDRNHTRRQVDQAPDAALRRREVDDGAGVPVRGVPRPPVPLLHPRRGRGGARRPQPRPLPDTAATPLRRRPVHRDHPPAAHDGGRRLALWRLDGRQRRLEGALTATAGRESSKPEVEVAEVA